LTLLALAVGAMLGVAAPQALAVPKITLDISPAASRLNTVVAVTGEAYPAELVGEYVKLSVQAWDPGRRRWDAAASRKLRVKFTAPQSWQGKFNIEYVQPPGLIGSYTYAGQVTYTLDSTDLGEHVAHYKLTSATGDFNNDCSFPGFSSTSTWRPDSDWGDLWWYFAEDKGGSTRIPADSYDGSANHSFTGRSTITQDGFTYVVDPAEESIGAMIWVPGEAAVTARPLVTGFDWSTPGKAVGFMRKTVVRYDSALLTTESLDWDLESSAGAEPYAVRHGDFTQKYRANKKGLYRMRGTIARTADHPTLNSPWRKLTVR
jgi:hypothetical protein